MWAVVLSGWYCDKSKDQNSQSSTICVFCTKSGTSTTVASCWPNVSSLGSRWPLVAKSAHTLGVL